MWNQASPIPKDQLISNIKNAAGLFCTLTDPIDKKVLENATNLKVVSTMSVGMDHLDISELAKNNIRIGYTPNILTEATAELTIGLLLATSRRLIEANREVHQGTWKSWAPQWMCGPGLNNKTIGIIGFGRIGQATARIIKSFCVEKIIYYNRSERAAAAAELGATRVDLDTLLADSDFVIVTCALAPETKGLISAEALKKMKNSAVLVNTSRGAVVDEKALADALKNNVIAAAGLDVMEVEPLPKNSPLLKLNNCVVLPHIGSATVETRQAMAVLTANNILSALNEKPMPAEFVPIK